MLTFAIVDNEQINWIPYIKTQQRVFVKDDMGHGYNESTAGADASVEALKLYDMKLYLP